MRDSLGDVENQGCEAILVKVDFLVVWYLANIAVGDGELASTDDD